MSNLEGGEPLGKDFVSAYIILRFFLTRGPVRIMTTSADYVQLEAVLWGEIRRFVQTAKYPLDSKDGGCLLMNHLHIRKIIGRDVCPLSYLIGKQCKKGEGALGHHIAKIGDNIPRTLLVGDEASGLEDIIYERGATWAERILLIGNPYSAMMNVFERGCKQGDIIAKGA